MQYGGRLLVRRFALAQEVNTARAGLFMSGVFGESGFKKLKYRISEILKKGEENDD